MCIRDRVKRAIETIEKELDERLKELRDKEKLLEAQRLEQRTRYDLSLIHISSSSAEESIRNLREISFKGMKSVDDTVIEIMLNREG